MEYCNSLFAYNFWRDYKTEDPKAGEKQLSTVKPGTAGVTVCLVQMYTLFSCFAIWFAIPTLAISL